MELFLTLETNIAAFEFGAVNPKNAIAIAQVRPIAKLALVMIATLFLNIVLSKKQLFIVTRLKLMGIILETCLKCRLRS
ncbi:hypothetical protein DSM106972_008450 [Dulcicalothrix desertica PCC 7102]|uniref:Uncharacterized protein n=1 Tax=Dulcicalothrix desertica PCC 7102 TaxID=232991 RepID=A0A3S1CSU4_9CYAN|nr:hypothetical protein DSM106972_008450 [Dulcicalothrix desertica PCC 7102]